MGFWALGVQNYRDLIIMKLVSGKWNSRVGCQARVHPKISAVYICEIIPQLYIHEKFWSLQTMDRFYSVQWYPSWWSTSLQRNIHINVCKPEIQNAYYSSEWGTDDEKKRLCEIRTLRIKSFSSVLWNFEVDLIFCPNFTPNTSHEMCLTLIIETLRKWSFLK